MSRKLALVAVAVVLTLGAACGGKSADTVSGSPSAAPAAKTVLRLGYFPNLTHATAIAGVEKGFFAKHLGADVDFKTTTFNAGGDAVTALFGNQLDATFIGPSPTLNAWSKSNGKAIKILAGATSGGAYLVVKPEITSAAQLKGKTIASPQLGNTQDVALRAWLKSQNLKTDVAGGGDVHVKPQENPVTVDTFKAGQIDGAWVPEPYASRLVDAGGKVLVDEKTLWPNGRYVTTQLIVRTEYLTQHPDVIKNLLAGDLEADEYVNKNGAEAQTLVNSAIQKLTSKSLDPKILASAWKNLTFTVDPVASSLKKSADEAVSLGLIKAVDLTGIYDLAPLNELLKAAGREEVSGL